MFFKPVLVTVALLLGGFAHAQDEVINYSDSDAVMNAAIAQARETFPLFMVQYYREAEDTGAFLDAFSVKVEMLTSDGVTTEIIWVSPFIETETGFLGLLANDPDDLPGLAYGSEIEFTFDQIADWSYVRGGRGFGNFTTRVMLPDIDADLAQELKDYLSEVPLPAEWGL